MRSLKSVPRTRLYRYTLKSLLPSQAATMRWDELPQLPMSQISSHPDNHGNPKRNSLPPPPPPPSPPSPRPPPPPPLQLLEQVLGLAVAVEGHGMLGAVERPRARLLLLSPGAHLEGLRFSANRRLCVAEYFQEIRYQHRHTWGWWAVAEIMLGPGASPGLAPLNLHLRAVASFTLDTKGLVSEFERHGFGG